MSETPLDLLRQALVAKLNVDLRRPHAATAAAQRVAVLAAQLDEELAPDRARGTDEELGGDDDDDLDEQASRAAWRPAADDADEDEDDLETAGAT